MFRAKRNRVFEEEKDVIDELRLETGEKRRKSLFVIGKVYMATTLVVIHFANLAKFILHLQILLSFITIISFVFLPFRLLTVQSRVRIRVNVCHAIFGTWKEGNLNLRQQTRPIEQPLRRRTEVSEKFLD